MALTLPLEQGRDVRRPSTSRPTTAASASTGCTPATPAVPVPQLARVQRLAGGGNSHGDGELDSDGAVRANSPLAYLASSSPSRALSRFWDRLSPPSIPSPFQVASAPPYPPAFLGRLDRDTEPMRADDPVHDRFASTADAASTAASRPVLEQHDSASQLSFSLRRAAVVEPMLHRNSGTRPASSQDGPRQTRRPRTDSWEPPFRLPSMPWKGKEKQEFGTSAIPANGDRDSDSMIDDEACFVDGWEGKVGALKLVSVPTRAPA